MICKRGLEPCHMIGCDCYATAPIEEIDAELEAAGINLDDLSKRTKTIVRIASENLDQRNTIKELVDCLHCLACAVISEVNNIPNDLKHQLSRATALVNKHKEVA